MEKKKSKRKASNSQVADKLRKPGQGKSFSTFQFIGLAKEACKNSAHGNQPMVAIILSAVAVETFLNEAVEVAEPFVFEKEGWEDEPEKLEALQSIVGDLERQRSSTSTKLQVAHFILTGKSIKRGEALYQDFDLLMSLRNQLVHSRVEKFEVGLGLEKEYEPHPLVKRLMDRKVIKAPPKTAGPRCGPYINKPEVAEWAYDVALKTIKLVIDLFPEGHSKETLVFMYSSHTKL